MHEIELRHNFETAHRLLHADSPVKCRSIHGHSWWATVSITAPSLNELGMIVEFGTFKTLWRAFLDSQLDHHLVLKQGDPLAAAIRSVEPDARIRELPFDPTTEHLAEWIYHQSSAILQSINPSASITRLHIQETSVNAAVFRP